MGIGPIAVRVLKELVDRGLLKKGMSMLELGSQQICVHKCEKAKTTLEGISREFGAGPYIKKFDPNREFMRSLGFDYVSIDIDGKYGAHPLDLNHELRPIGDRFDLVTNFGTTEHIFNQAQCFKTIHACCKIRGLIVHAVPMAGYAGHCFYSYDPGLFRDMAKANSYEIIGLWRCADELSHYPDLVDSEGLVSGDKISIVCILRRMSAQEFVFPMQEQYDAK
jgi:Methyltransferase domain